MKRALLVILFAACGSGQKTPAVQPHTATPPPTTKPVAASEGQRPMQITGNFGPPVCEKVKGGPDAAAAFAKACSAKGAEGCLELALRYQCGQGVEHDPAKAASFAGQACDLGNSTGCDLAMLAYATAGPLFDGPKAFHYAEKGCQLGSADSCGNLALAYWQGIGVAADPARAVTMLEQQCKQSKPLGSCANLATMLYMGTGVPRDVARATELAQRACDGHIDNACNILGAILMDRGGDANIELGIAKFDEACQHAVSPACDNLGQVYLRGAGTHQKDLEKAKALFQRACDLGNSAGCTHLGQAMSGP